MSHLSRPYSAAAQGYDHDWYGWVGAARPSVTWPGNTRTAVSLIIHLGAIEWEADGPPRPAPAGGRGVATHPDFPRMSHREFGHRVGVFRLLDVLDQLGIVPAAVVDVMTAECYQPLMDRLLPHVSEVVAGGLSASRPLTSEMSEDEEEDYIGQTLDRLQAAVGTRSEGWLGPGHSESSRTPRLLAHAGLSYVADWGNDDLPYPMCGAGPNLWAFPLSWELSDLSAMFFRSVSPDIWSRGVMEAFDVLHAEEGRVLSVHLQPWISGQAFRAGALERALSHVVGASGVWFAPPAAVVAHCRNSGLS